MAFDADEIIKQFGPALARVAASYERDPSLRDELTQEVLIAVVTALPRLSQPDKVKPFVFRIAHNRCLSHVTKRIRERESEQQLIQLEDEFLDQEAVILARERGARLLEAVRQLALPYRQVVALILEDLSYEEIAETLGISIGNVGARVNRAKQQLRALLDHE